MTGLVRRATLIAAAGLLAATAAMAGVPSATTSSQPANLFMRVMGQSAGVQDPASNISYTIRDAANNPVPNSVVILNFTACTDVRLCNNAPQPTGTANCGAHTVTGVTNGSGQITFGIVGSSNTAAASTGSCVSVTADGVPLSNLHAVTADYDGASGLNLLDVSACFGDVLAATNRARSDFDNNAAVNLLDVSSLFGLVLAGGSPSSCTTLCP